MVVKKKNSIINESVVEEEGDEPNRQYLTKRYY